MKNKSIYIVAIFCCISFVALNVFWGYRLYKSHCCLVKRCNDMYVQLKNVQLENALLYQLYEPRLCVGAEQDSMRILVLGNSITWHVRKDDIGWHSEWGMAASSPENDFCHVLGGSIRGGVTPCNMACWENDLSMNLDSLLGDTINGYDAIVIRIGENVSNIDVFENALDDLIVYCMQHAPIVVITGCFWQDVNKEKIIVSSAYRHRITYIPLFWIDKLYDVHPKVGDEFKSVEGDLYKLEDDFIISHPDDRGMQMIANQILRSITNEK